MFNFENKVVVITGGARGIGKCIREKFEENGATVCVIDLLENGYDGGFSMEPHLAVVFHDDKPQAESDVRYQNYVSYGRKFEALLRDCGWNF